MMDKIIKDMKTEKPLVNGEPSLRYLKYQQRDMILLPALFIRWSNKVSYSATSVLHYS